ncbi:SMI1/KNR4 family protein [Streptomyces sp. NPDC057621]|uniref:SMI1/KNR4 family protein n=1 Tax=Streptomyces sp. NPDC057621 TaxID=3346186 RepID=UPI0036B9746E
MSEMHESNEAAVTAVLTTPEAWRGYLRRYDELYLRNRASDQELFDLLEEDEVEALDEGGRLERWLGEEPAQDETVAASEGRLGVRFPPSLRGFLLASDGWIRVSGWVDLVYPCARIEWMRDTGAGASLIPLYGEEFDNDEYADLFRRSMEVAAGEDVWLLDPTDIGPDGEWAAYLFTPKYGDLRKFTSFATLFHHGYKAME